MTFMLVYILSHYKDYQCYINDAIFYISNKLSPLITVPISINLLNNIIACLYTEFY